MVAEIFFADAGAIREQPPERKGAVRLRLSVYHSGPMDCRFRKAGDSQRSAATDFEGECGQAVGVEISGRILKLLRARRANGALQLLELLHLFLRLDGFPLLA